MANTTISQLTPIVGTDVAATDSFIIYDVSANTEKQITSAELKSMVGNGSFTFTTSSASDALVVTSTDAGATGAPDIVFYRNSASPAASDAIGNIIFKGKSSTGVDRNYAGIFTSIVSPTNSAETGRMTFSVMGAGTLTERMRIDSSGNVGIGTLSPTEKLHVVQNIASTKIQLKVENDSATAGSNAELNLDAVGNNFSIITYPDADTPNENRTNFYSSAGSSYFTFSPAGTERLRITSTGDVGIGTSTPASKLQVAGQIAGGYTAHANGTTAMTLGTNTAVKVTPTATATFTTTVAPAGSRASVIILTSGTTSYTITFGTGFKTTGTLATGTTTARTFVIEFISDGTSMIEASRTVAMA